MMKRMYSSLEAMLFYLLLKMSLPEMTNTMKEEKYVDKFRFEFKLYGTANQLELQTWGIWFLLHLGQPHPEFLACFLTCTMDY